MKRSFFFWIYVCSIDFEDSWYVWQHEIYVLGCNFTGNCQCLLNQCLLNLKFCQIYELEQSLSLPITFPLLVNEKHYPIYIHPQHTECNFNFCPQLNWVHHQYYKNAPAAETMQILTKIFLKVAPYHHGRALLQHPFR